MKKKLPQFVIVEKEGVKKVMKYADIRDLRDIKWYTFNSLTSAENAMTGADRDEYADLVGELFFDYPVKGYSGANCKDIDELTNEAILFGD